MSEEISTPMRAAPVCPVCRARFRGTAVCSRCGTDLASLMDIATKAWKMRRQSVEALHAGKLALALRLMHHAELLHRAAPSPELPR